MTHLYTCTIRRPDGPTRNLATVHAVRAATPYGGNWFKAAGDFLTPSRDAIRDALPLGLRKAWEDADGWFDAYGMGVRFYIRDAGGRVRATVTCEGYTYGQEG